MNSKPTNWPFDLENFSDFRRKLNLNTPLFKHKIFQTHDTGPTTWGMKNSNLFDDVLEDGCEYLYMNPL